MTDEPTSLLAQLERVRAELAASQSGAMSDPRLHALVAEWRERASLGRGNLDRTVLHALPSSYGERERIRARAAMLVSCASELEAALTEHEPEMHRVPYGDGKTALVSGPVGERMAAAAAADGGSDDES